MNKKEKATKTQEVLAKARKFIEGLRKEEQEYFDMMERLEKCVEEVLKLTCFREYKDLMRFKYDFEFDAKCKVGFDFFLNPIDNIANDDEVHCLSDSTINIKIDHAKKKNINPLSWKYNTNEFLSMFPEVKKHLAAYRKTKAIMVPHIKRIANKYNVDTYLLSNALFGEAREQFELDKERND